MFRDFLRNAAVLQAVFNGLDSGATYTVTIRTVVLEGDTVRAQSQDYVKLFTTSKNSN